MLCLGDCLDVLPTISEQVDMVFADLPYGTTRNQWDSIIPFDALWTTKSNGAIVFTSAQPFTSSLIMSNPRYFKYELIWIKDNCTGFLNANRQPLRRHESVIVFYREQPTYNPQKTSGKPYTTARKSTGTNYGFAESLPTVNLGDRFPSSVLHISRDKQKVHPTQKPVALLEWLIKTYSNPGDIILDPTMGSGTTGVACANTGRRFIGIERDPTYFETAQRRIAEVDAGGMQRSLWG